MHDYMRAVLPPANAEGDVRVCLDGMVRLLLDTYPSADDDTLILYFHPEDRAAAAADLTRLRKDRAEMARFFASEEVPEVLYEATPLYTDPTKRPGPGWEWNAARGTAGAWCSPEEAKRHNEAVLASRAAETDRLSAEQHEQIVCVVGLITNDWNDVLLIRSKKPGRRWELPGGKKKRGETWRASTLREIEEETGITPVLAPGAPLAVIDGVPVAGAGYPSIVLIVAGKSQGDAAWSSMRPGGDAAEVGWFKLTGIPWDDLSKIGSADTLRAYAVQMGLPEVAR